MFVIEHIGVGNRCCVSGNAMLCLEDVGQAYCSGMKSASSDMHAVSLVRLYCIGTQPESVRVRCKNVCPDVSGRAAFGTWDRGRRG